jgi:hypothetical protein
MWKLMTPFLVKELKYADARDPFPFYHEIIKTYGRHGRFRTVDLYRVKVALSP